MACKSMVVGVLLAAFSSLLAVSPALAQAKVGQEGLTGYLGQLLQALDQDRSRHLTHTQGARFDGAQVEAFEATTVEHLASEIRHSSGAAYVVLGRRAVGSSQLKVERILAVSSVNVPAKVAARHAGNSDFRAVYSSYISSARQWASELDAGRSNSGLKQELVTVDEAILIVKKSKAAVFVFLASDANLGSSNAGQRIFVLPDVLRIDIKGAATGGGGASPQLISATGDFPSTVSAKAGASSGALIVPSAGSLKSSTDKSAQQASPTDDVPEAKTPRGQAAERAKTARRVHTETPPFAPFNPPPPPK